jgi:chemotaxis signal transduction protein
MLALVFDLGGVRCALPCAQIHEVLPLLPLQGLPGLAEHVAGMFVYRGSVIPVLDAGLLLNRVKSPLRLSTRLVVVHVAGRQVALVCPGAHAVRVLAPFAGATAPLFGEGLIERVLADDGAPVHVLSLSALAPHLPAANPSTRSHEGTRALP